MLHGRHPRPGEIHDLTPALSQVVAEGGIQAGTATVFVVGSTAALTTVEYEPGLVEDLQSLFERIAPRDLSYAHEERWHDGNGHSQARASLLGPSLLVPFAEARRLLGTWPGYPLGRILIDFDNRPRQREIVVQLMGE